MTDWTGVGVATARQWRHMARTQFGGVSPSYQAVAVAVADSEPLLARLDARPDAERQPTLLLGAVRYLAGPVDDPAAFVTWTLAHWDAVAQLLATRRTQTNEPRRCASLLPVLAALPGPLALVEVGASAGLCLQPDRYAYRYLRASGAPVTVGRSALTLSCELTGSCDVTGPAPLPAAVPEVVWRRGLDLHPLDVRDDDDVRWLESLVWPEQTERFDILAAAVEIARLDPPPVLPGDLRVDLPALVAGAPPEATVVVHHSAVLAYLGPADREAFARSVAALPREVVWVSAEAPGIVATPSRPPAGGVDGRARFVVSRGRTPLAWAGPHGDTLEWFGGVPADPDLPADPDA